MGDWEIVRGGKESSGKSKIILRFGGNPKLAALGDYIIMS